MSEILDKLEEIKNSTNHAWGIFLILVSIFFTNWCLYDIEKEQHNTNTLLKLMVEQQVKKDSSSIANNNHILMPNKPNEKKYK